MKERISKQVRRASGHTICEICGNTVALGTFYLEPVGTYRERGDRWRECPTCAPVGEALLATEGVDL